MTFLVQEVSQIHIDQPSVDLLVLKNSQFHGNRLIMSNSLRGRVQLPTMYESWTHPRNQHVHLEYMDTLPEIENAEKDLIIFDTWGTSSYYHLLIDHVVPLWITREYLKSSCGILGGLVDYYRISRNGYPTELHTAREIFNYFFRDYFVESAEGTYKNIVYGYFYSYRPYHGPKYPRLSYSNVRYWLSRFRDSYCVHENKQQGQAILVPYRSNRIEDFVDDFVQKYCHRINFQSVDFGSLSIADQIKISGSARGIFGCEGAAFANSIFMKKGAKVVPVSSDPSRFLFHSTLADYIGHSFKAVHINSERLPSISEEDLLQFFDE